MITSGLIGTISSITPDFITNLGLGPKTIEGLLCGVFEITTGANLIHLSDTALVIRLCCVSLVIGWAGFSVHTQVMSIVSTTDIRVKPYLVGKALQGIISCLYTFIGYSLFRSLLLKESPVFANNSVNIIKAWGNLLTASIQYILIASFIMTAVSILYICITSILSKKSLF
jgi:hypothetical protein